MNDGCFSMSSQPRASRGPIRTLSSSCSLVSIIDNSSMLHCRDNRGRHPANHSLLADMDLCGPSLHSMLNAFLRCLGSQSTLLIRYYANCADK